MIEGVLEAVFGGILDWLKSKGILGKIIYGLFSLVGIAFLIWLFFFEGKN